MIDRQSDASIHLSIYISIYLSIYLDEGVSYDPGTNDPEEFGSNIAQIDDSDRNIGEYGTSDDRNIGSDDRNIGSDDQNIGSDDRPLEDYRHLLYQLTLTPIN